MTAHRRTTPTDTYPGQYDTGRSAYRRRRPGYRRSSCLRFAVMLFLSIAVGLAASGYVLWQLSKTLPRTNLLILGLDRRPGEGYVVRSDTIVLTTVYPPDARIGLLSIPRDLYVDIPGQGSSRINTAHFWGENDAQGNGPRLAMQTVALNFGVAMDHYVRVDFAGFRAVVDAVGGIDIDVETAIVDDAYPTADYGTMRIEIPAGPQRMDGETALRYARTRHGFSDFYRAQRQQKVLVALAHRLLEPKVWPRLPAFYLAVMNNVDTDLTGKDLVLMAPTLYRAGPDGIEHHVVDYEMTQPWTTPNGGAVLLPRWEVIHPLMQELFTP